MDAVVASLVGVGVGAVVTLVTQILTGYRERLQWERQHKLEYEKWLRDKTQEIYGNCLYYAGSAYYSIDDKIRDSSPIEFSKLQAERAKFYDSLGRENQKWLNLLAVYHPFPNTEEYQEFCELIRASKVSREYLYALARRDPRLSRGSNDMASTQEKHQAVSAT